MQRRAVGTEAFIETLCGEKRTQWTWQTSARFANTSAGALQTSSIISCQMFSLTTITLDVWRRDSSVNEILLHTDDTHRGADKHKAEVHGRVALTCVCCVFKCLCSWGGWGGGGWVLRRGEGRDEVVSLRRSHPSAGVSLAVQLPLHKEVALLFEVDVAVGAHEATGVTVFVSRLHHRSAAARNTDKIGQECD